MYSAGSSDTSRPFDAPIRDLSEDDFGEDIAIDDDLESILLAAESQGRSSDLGNAARSEYTRDLDVDIEDLGMKSPFQQFRKKGWLSVSDLVGTVWCEVQVSDDSGWCVSAEPSPV